MYLYIYIYMYIYIYIYIATAEDCGPEAPEGWSYDGPQEAWREKCRALRRGMRGMDSRTKGNFGTMATMGIVSTRGTKGGYRERRLLCKREAAAVLHRCTAWSAARLATQLRKVPPVSF